MTSLQIVALSLVTGGTMLVVQNLYLTGVTFYAQTLRTYLMRRYEVNWKYKVWGVVLGSGMIAAGLSLPG